MIRDSFLLTLKSQRMITPAVRHLEFVHENGEAFNYIPGQFITFHFEMDGEQQNRSYSIASIPSKTHHIEIAVSPFKGGAGTRLLFNLNLGDTIKTTGPFGRLILRDETPKRYIMVATGTGITPYRAMLPELHKRITSEDSEAIILVGVQTPEDLLYGEDFIEFANNHERMQFHAYYSREMPDNPQAHEHHGYVQTAFPQLNLQPEQDIIYLCGNPNMIDTAFQLLLDTGFSTRQIRREKYISPKKRVRS